MEGTTNKPLIFLAFADEEGSLRQLRKEADDLRKLVQKAKSDNLCDFELLSNVKIEHITDVFQRNRDRVAVFHYGGHANGFQLLLESYDGKGRAAGAKGLAQFLAQQASLQLVFLNGCSTELQVDALLNAGVSAVIATSVNIDDSVAREFSRVFYNGVITGATIEKAFREAEGATKASKSIADNPRALYWSDKVAEDRWPWKLHSRPGAEKALEWNLPDAADDPLFGLPKLPEQDLPASPYRHLNWFERQHANVFFGRGYEIRRLYYQLTTPETAPIVLFYGRSGVGKSSFLAAGLLPRLESEFEVRYCRRNQELGLVRTLTEAISARDDNLSIRSQWVEREEQLGKPLIVVLDQVEEVFTRPRAAPTDELSELVMVLRDIFLDRTARPAGKLLLSFRKEWYTDLKRHLDEAGLFYKGIGLESLTRRGIIRVVNGPAQDQILRLHYGLSIEEGLGEVIADDLLDDRDATLTPVLQILLTRLWHEANSRNKEAPHFSLELYRSVKRDGLYLRDFLNRALEAIRLWQNAVLDSGLVLDLLEHHTTGRGTAEQCSQAELAVTYSHQSDVLPELTRNLSDQYVLTKVDEDGTRLAHDTLGPLIRERFESSERPGQRARRILESRVVDWRAGHQGATLDGADLQAVERGRNGMRIWTDDEHRLVTKSRSRRQKKRFAVAGGVAVIVGAMLAGQWLMNFMQVETHKRSIVAESVRLARQADIVQEESPRLAALLAIEAVNYSDRSGYTLWVPEAQQSLRKAISGIKGIGLSPRRAEGEVIALSVDSGANWVVAVSDESTATVWNLKNESPALPAFEIADVNVAVVSASGRWLLASKEPEDGYWSPNGDPVSIGTVDLLAWDLLAGGPANDPIVLDGKPLYFAESNVPDFQYRFRPIDESGRWAITILSEENFRLWDLNASDLTVESIALKHSCFDWPDCLVEFGAGRWLFVGDDQTVKVWDLWRTDLNERGGEPHFSLLGHARVTSVTVDDSGRWAVTGDEDYTLRAWDLWAADLTSFSLSFQVETELTAIDAGAGKLVTVTDKSSEILIQVWDLNGGEISEPIAEFLTAALTTDIEAIDIDPSGRWIIASCNDCDSPIVWDLDVPVPATSRKDLSDSLYLPRRRTDVSVMAVIPNPPAGAIIVAGHEDGTVGVWATDTLEFGDGLVEKIKEHDVEVTAIATGWGSFPLATADEAGNVRVFYSQPVVPELLSSWVRYSYNGNIDSTGSWLAYSDFAGNAWVWNVARAGSPILLDGLDGPDKRNLQRNVAIAVSASGERAITTFDHDVIVWDINPLNSSAVRQHIGNHPGAHLVAIDGTGSSGVTASGNGSIRLWNLAGAESRLVAQQQLKNRNPIIGLEVDHAGNGAITVGSDGEILVWELDGLNLLSEPKSFPSGGVVATSVQIAPSGDRVVTGHQDGSVRLWDISSEPSAVGPPLTTGSGAPVVAVAIASNEEMVIAATDDGRLWRWDLRIPETAERSELSTEEMRFGITAVSLTEDGRTAITLSKDAGIRKWDLQTSASSRLVAPNDGVPFWTSMEKGGRWAVTTSSHYVESYNEFESYIEPDALWDLQAPDPYASKVFLPVPKRDERKKVDLPCWVGKPISYSDGRWWLVACAGDKTAWAWDLRAAVSNQAWIPLRGHSGSINSVVVDETGRWVLSASDDKTARIWDLSSATPSDNPIVLTGHQDRVIAAVFDSGASRALTGSTDGTARIWDLSAPIPSNSVITLVGHAEAVLAVTFSDDSTRALTGSADDTAKLWNLKATSPEPITFVGHQNDVDFVAFGSAGRWAATGSKDQSVRLWDLSASALSGMSFSIGTNVTSLVLDDENERILIGTSEGDIQSRPISSDVLIDKARRLVGRNLTCEEWTRYFAEEPYHRTFPELPAAIGYCVERQGTGSESRLNKD